MKNSFNDMVGFGKIVEVLVALLKYYFPNQSEKLDLEIKKEKIKELKIKNFKSLDNHLKKTSTGQRKIKY